MKDPNADPSKYDFLILGAPVIYHKLLNHKWVKAHLTAIASKPVIYFTVSGASSGPKLDGWITNSLPKDLISRMQHVVLRGRLNPKELLWYDRLMLLIGGLKNPDPVARKEELNGFDFMDKASIAPILKLVKQYQKSDAIT